MENNHRGACDLWHCENAFQRVLCLAISDWRASCLSAPLQCNRYSPDSMPVLYSGGSPRSARLRALFATHSLRQTRATLKPIAEPAKPRADQLLLRHHENREHCPISRHTSRRCTGHRPAGGCLNCLSKQTRSALPLNGAGHAANDGSNTSGAGVL